VNALSETRLSTDEIKSWLEKETGSTFTPVKTQAQKHRDEMQAALQSLADASKMLLDNSQKEIEKRNMKVYNRARALNKLAHLFVERLKKLKVPDQISYDSLSTFNAETQKALAVTEIDIRNWFPRISPFFIMDRRKFLAFYERTKMTYNSLNDFVTKEYVKTKTLERTFHLITEVQALEKQLADVETQKEALKNERHQIEKEIATLQQESAGLKGKATIDEFSHVEAEAEALNNELRYIMRHLQKPFLKMQALAVSGGGAGLTPDELKRLEQYMENPFEAIQTEDAGCQALKEILQKLARLISEDKLKLKDEKARKAEQALEEILKRDSLASIHGKCIEVSTKRKQLATSPEMEEAKQSLSHFQQQMEKLQSRQVNLEADEKVKENARQELLDRIRSHKRTIEVNIQSFLGKQVQIQ
jgi:hypothetical protein